MIIVRITEHRGILCIEGPTPDFSHKNWVPSDDGEGRIGCVVMDTAQHLGVSAEALELLKTIPRGRGGLGEVDWFGTDARGQAFGWIGAPWAFVDPKHAEGSRDYRIGDHVTIPNEPPPEAVDVLDSDWFGQEEEE